MANDQLATSGHGSTRGYTAMNNKLKAYFRKKGNPHQKRVDRAFIRTGPPGTKAVWGGGRVRMLRGPDGKFLPWKKAK